MDVRRGPWTAEEDAILASYVAVHGEGRWESLARGAGLRRTGKSCRLRWLNYLRPDVRRGNITAEEQLLILQLHSRWGNRWSKIAEHLPGRTDNEIKNYWRTRVQKHARSLRCDPNGRQFQDIISQLWVPHLLLKIQRATDSVADMVGGINTGSSSPSADGSGIDCCIDDAGITKAEIAAWPELDRIAVDGGGACEDWWSTMDEEFWNL